MTMSRRDFGKLGLAAAAVAGSGMKALAVESEEELAFLTMTEASARLKAGTVTSEQLTRACLTRISTLAPKTAAFITVLHDEAIEQAKAMDQERKAGKVRSAMHGIPISLKDNIDTEGIRTTAASASLEGRIPKESAPVAARLKDAGAVLVGKANLGEFAMSAQSFWGTVRNPWALDREPGGSSSGPGVAVSTGMCFGSLGTDTAGSVRHPANFCGIVGLKPTYGLVPIRGIIPLTASLDHCGPMTRTVEDTAMMLNVIAGYDREDITSVNHPKEDYLAAMRQPVKGFRLGKPGNGFDNLDPDVADCANKAIEMMVAMTAGIKPVSLPAATDFTWTSLGGETYAWHRQNFKSSAPLYQTSTRASVQALAEKEGGFADDYIDLLWGLQKLRREIDLYFQDIDLVVLPTMIHPPRKLGRNSFPPGFNWADYTNTPEYNAYGIPAISVPCGFTREGLPVGVMIAGPSFSEGKVLALAAAYEKVTAWHTKHPSLTAETPVPDIS